MKLPCKNILLLAGLIALTACAVGPDYVKPKIEVPEAYKEQSGGWKKATPQDDKDRGSWWKIYNDPVLNDLVQQVNVSNQNLKAAEAAYRTARAVADESNAALFPSLSLEGGMTRSGSFRTGAKTQNQYSTAVGASWEPDVWGRIRRSLESDVASAQASAADLASAQLSAQSELVTAYYNLRAQDELINLLNETVTAYKRSLKIAQDRYNVGVAAKADVIAAQTQLDTTQAQTINAGVRRAQYEHAIAALIGKTPADFSLAYAPLIKEVPNMPAEMPSALLERRPDIAAAERQMAAANAQIGVETAAFFPNLTLAGSYGYTSVALSKLFQASNSLWSFGPALAVTVFDAGARSARVEQARASFDQTVASYRQTVLTAFQQVEDQLAAVRILGEQEAVADTAVKSAKQAEQFVLNQYKAGIVPYSSVVTAQAATLNNEQSALAVHLNRLNASVALIEALGGSWNNLQLPAEDQITKGITF